MAIDVSVYSLRISDGYLSTVAGGTVLDSGASPFAAASSSGGGSTGVVRITGDQRVSGLKIFDASSYFEYDISVGNDIFIGGTNLMPYIDGSLAERDVSIAWLRDYQVVQDGSIAATSGATKSYIDGSLGQRDVSIAWLSNNMLKEASIGDGFKWDSGLLEPSINTATALSELTDVTLSSLAAGDALAYRSGEWRNEITINIEDVFQAKVNSFSPDSSGAGSMGDLAYDASYFYICTSTNIWMRFLGENNY